MVGLFDIPKPKRKPPNLVLHCGAQAADLNEVSRVTTPAATESWQPIPHHQLIQTVQRTLATTRLTIGTTAHSLSHDGMRYFGLMEVHGQKNSDDYCWVLGLRNSHDKTFPAGIVAGASVFVCDNLSFSGEVKFARKHTRFINRDLPQLTERAIGLLMAKGVMHARRQALLAIDLRGIAHGALVLAELIGQMQRVGPVERCAGSGQGFAPE